MAGRTKRRSRRTGDDGGTSRFLSGRDDDPEVSNLLGISSSPLFNPLSLLPGNFSFDSFASSLTPTKIVVYGGILALLLAPLLDSIISQATTMLNGSKRNKGKAISAELTSVGSDGKYHGRYPNSLLTLFYPFTLLRDVVLDQPIHPNDVPFFWHVHTTDEEAVKKVLTTCYGADLVELNTVEDVEKAKKLDLISSLEERNRIGIGALNSENERLYNGQRRSPLIITSPHIREVAELFDQDHFGRMFSFYRHPIDYDVHPRLKEKLPPEAGANNFLTRLLSDVHSGDIGFKELGIAKQVIRQVTVTGTRDLMAESLFRTGKYFGWVPVSGTGTKDGEEKDDIIAKSCIDNQLQAFPGERYADHNSREWQVFYNANKMDCQLYELARSTWRAQIQTIIPLTLQKKRAGEDDEDEEDGDEELQAAAEGGRKV